MSFTRYEIRWYYCEDGDFKYIPFDTLSEAEKHARDNPYTCKGEDGRVSCGIYKVTLYSDWEKVERIKDL